MIRLTPIALQVILDHSPGIKSKLALALNCSESAINRYIRDNSDNLTKAAALIVLEEETGLTKEDLLVRE